MSNSTVEYVDHMGTDLNIVNAARVSFSKVSTEFDDKDRKLVNYLADHNHWSPFGHAFISLRIKAPIFVARQLVKHQVGLCWNEVSRRYVDDTPEYYVPESFRGKPTGGVKQGSSDIEISKVIIKGVTESWETEALDIFHLHMDTCTRLYESYIEAGIAPEQARMILPLNTMTEWIWSGSLYAFARVCELRLDAHAQKECRDIAVEIADICSEKFPACWNALMYEDE